MATPEQLPVKQEPIPTIGISRQEVENHLTPLRANGNPFFLSSIEEDTEHGKSKRFLIGLNVVPEFTDEAWKFYVNKIPDTVPLVIPMLKQVVSPSPQGNVVADQKLYLREAPELGFLTFEEYKNYRDQKRAAEKEALDLLATMVDSGNFQSDRENEDSISSSEALAWELPATWDKDLAALPEEDEEERISIMQKPKVIFAHVLVQKGDFSDWERPSGITHDQMQLDRKNLPPKQEPDHLPQDKRMTVPCDIFTHYMI